MNARSRYQERLEPLQRLSVRLAVSGVPNVLRRHEHNGAPSVGDGPTMPVVVLAGGWRWVKVLFWDGEPRFSYPYSYSRWPVDDAGVDRLASRITVDYCDAKARGQVDGRGM